jgi:hypothetical protein
MCADSVKQEVRMQQSRQFRPSRAWRCALIASGAAVLLAAAPVRAQSAPAARNTPPPTATAGRDTAVPTEFDLPAGYTLAAVPRLRVLDARGKLVELVPIYLSQPAPNGRGQRLLTTSRYRPGPYQVRLEVECRDASGRSQSVASPWSTLTVPGS